MILGKNSVLSIILASQLLNFACDRPPTNPERQRHNVTPTQTDDSTIKPYDSENVAGEAQEGSKASNTKPGKVPDPANGMASTKPKDSDAAMPVDGPGVPKLVWPNEQSLANSSQWLIDNHDKIEQLQPKYLAINFLGSDKVDAIKKKLTDIEFALEEASKFKGYSNPKAPAFIDYKLTEIRTVGQPFLRTAAQSFDYFEFINGRGFADRLGIKDLATQKNLTVCELFEKGLVNEIWVVEDPNDSGKFFESKHYGQAYDAKLQKLGTMNPCTGNGCLDARVKCSVSMRFQEMNLARGPGCASHALGHGIEGLVRSNNITELNLNGMRYLNFDLDKSFGLSFKDFYACDYKSSDCIRYKSPSELTSGVGIPPFNLTGFGTGCGNVHFAPHSRSHYDYESGATASALSTCENYGLGNDGKGRDLQNLVNYTTYKKWNEDPKFGDCGGGWMLYWRQNMPGYQNNAIGLDGKPMKNWLPYFFY